MNNDQYIQEYLNSENPTLEVIINAYLVRDHFYNLDNRETREKYLHKLGYIPELITKYKIEKQSDFVSNFILNHYRNYLNSNENYTIDFESIVNQYRNTPDYQLVQNKAHHDLERFNSLVNFLESSNQQFYQELTIDELKYLGW